MPNHVYNVISVEKKYADKLKEISKVGLMEYIKPMPKSLDIKCTGKPDEELNVQYEMNKNMYGHETWYSWRIEHWGTKWSDYETEFQEVEGGNLVEHDAHYSFTTAWNPPSELIMICFAKIIPNFTYTWEEEQGFGENTKWVDGQIDESFEWEEPDWCEVNEDHGDYPQSILKDLYYLEEPYTNNIDTYQSGYYLHGNLDSFIGCSMAEVHANLNEK